MKKLLLGSGWFDRDGDFRFGRRSGRPSLHQGALRWCPAIYDWSGFYIGANGGWGWSRKCWDITVHLVVGGCPSTSPKVATMRPAAPSAARSAIAGRPLLGVRPGSTGQLG